MMRRWLRRAAMGAGAALGALAVAGAVWCARGPVLVVTEASFAAIYGQARLRQERAAAARALGRRVRPVLVADGAGPDVVALAAAQAARRPACVVFPRSQALAARRFHEQFPRVRTVALTGLVGAPELPPPDGFLCVYGTDRAVDLYRAGLLAGLVGATAAAVGGDAAAAGGVLARTTYVLWQDGYMPAGGRELFARGVQEQEPEGRAVFVNTAAQMPDSRGIACVTLTGAGGEYLERNAPVPHMVFGWLNPALLPDTVAAQFDDSVWALAVPAARMAARGQPEGKIPSRAVILPPARADKAAARRLEQAAKKMP